MAYHLNQRGHGTTQRDAVHIVVHTLTIYLAADTHRRTSPPNGCNDPDSAFALRPVTPHTNMFYRTRVLGFSIHYVEGVTC